MRRAASLAATMLATILNIQRFSTHDGPGIRTTVFFKGCTNACAWCHNPESLHSAPELQVYPDQCIGCGRCLAVCSVGAHENVDGQKVFHRDRCARCGRCAEECFAQALVMAGKPFTVDELMVELVKDQAYYWQSHGGVTFSGGEPVLAGEFLVEALKRCKDQGFHTALQTAGNYPWASLAPMLPFVDLVMYDLKANDPQKHLEFVGTKLDAIRSNLAALVRTDVPVVVRTPVVGGVNDTLEEIEGIAKFVQSLQGVLQYELLPYHPLGNSKRSALGMPEAQRFQVPTRERMEELARIAGAYITTVAR